MLPPLLPLLAAAAVAVRLVVCVCVVLPVCRAAGVSWSRGVYPAAGRTRGNEAEFLNGVSCRAIGASWPDGLGRAGTL